MTHGANEKKLVKSYTSCSTHVAGRSRVFVWGMSLAGFKAAAQPSLDERQNAPDAGDGKGNAIARRETPSETTRTLMKRMVSSVIGDPA
jgi:hypothetical protein|tara:strand:- start:152 stop:418 length:267 start_codon:yes stop_codon:yes gene_type:complete